MLSPSQATAIDSQLVSVDLTSALSYQFFFFKCFAHTPAQGPAMAPFAHRAKVLSPQRPPQDFQHSAPITFSILALAILCSSQTGFWVSAKYILCFPIHRPKLRLFLQLGPSKSYHPPKPSAKGSSFRKPVWISLPEHIAWCQDGQVLSCP